LVVPSLFAAVPLNVNSAAAAGDVEVAVDQGRDLHVLPFLWPA
jgi:hypothetical protein